MNNNWSHLQAIEDILKMISVGEGSAEQLALAPDEFDRYCSYLLRCGLVTVNTDSGYVDLLRPTSAGKALLLLIDKIEALCASDIEEDTVEYREELDTRLPNREWAETIEWRDRIFQAYVLEEAELTRLEIQMEGVDDEEGESELEQRHQNLSVLRNLLDTFQRLVGELRG